MFRTILALAFVAGFLAAAVPLTAADGNLAAKGLVTSATTAATLTTGSYTVRTDASTGAGNQLVGGRGSSFQFPFWAAALPHYSNNGDHAAYWACGSGCGKGGLLDTAAAVTVDCTNAAKFAGACASAPVAGQKWGLFAGSDAPLSASEQARAASLGAEPVTLPLAIGTVAVAMNVNSCSQGQIQLTPSLISEIYLKHITMWNDARIVGNGNSCLSSEATAIKNEIRCDSSGTTFAFTDFLARSVGAPWTASQKMSPPAVSDGCGSGSSGLATAVAGTYGAIGYVELDQARSHGLKYAAVQNRAGSYVTPSEASGAAAADASAPTLPRAQDDWSQVSIAWAPGSASYPVSTFTYVIAIANPFDVVDGATAYNTQVTPDQVNAMKSLLTWMVGPGQAFIPNGYVPLGGSVRAISLAGIERINDGPSVTYTVKDVQTNGIPVADVYVTIDGSGVFTPAADAFQAWTAGVPPTTNAFVTCTGVVVGTSAAVVAPDCGLVGTVSPARAANVAAGLDTVVYGEFVNGHFVAFGAN